MEASQMQSTKRRVLCVDDNDDTCFLLTHLLDLQGYEARSVTTVPEALEAAQKESFNLYIIDQWFAQSSGTNLCRRIREFDPHTPIIIYSGTALDSDREGALQAGANAFVAKPYIEELVDTIRHFFTGVFEARA
jgi:two-component system response regulator CpxR